MALAFADAVSAARDPVTPAAEELQARVDSSFGSSAAYWQDVYGWEGLQGLVYRERMQTALRWVDELRLSPGARVLEVGCGAGLATLELARRGFEVESTDSSADMAALASGRVASAGLGGSVTVGVADVHALPHAGESFSLVFALGVLPWLHSPERALKEVARVLVPDGHLVCTADNRLRLNVRLKGPFLMLIKSPPLVPLKFAWRAMRRRSGSRPTGAERKLHRPSEVDGVLRAAGLQPERRTTVGFGPFMLLSRFDLGDKVGMRLHHALGSAARRFPQLRQAGWHYLVSARR